jgi:hypothetical protein
VESLGSEGRRRRRFGKRGQRERVGWVEVCYPIICLPFYIYFRIAVVVSRVLYVSSCAVVY